MNAPIAQQPHIVVNGHTLTPEEIGTVVAGLTVLQNTGRALEEASESLPDSAADPRGTALRSHQGRADRLRTLVLGAEPAAETDALTKRMRITVEVDAGRQEAFSRLWREFITGRSPQEAVIRQRAADHNQGIASLRELVTVAQRSSGQCRYIAHFLAALYNGSRFPFDVTDLRAIDPELWEHCMAVLRLDQHPEKEVHQYFVDGSKLWEERIIGKWNLDRDAALLAAQRLREYLEHRDSEPELAARLADWRRAIDPDSL